MTSIVYQKIFAAIAMMGSSLIASAQYFPTSVYPIEIQLQYAAQVEQQYGFVDIEALSGLLAGWGLTQPLPESDAEQTEEGICTGIGSMCILPTDNQDPSFNPVRNLSVITRPNGRARPGFKVKWTKPRRLSRDLRDSYKLDHYQVHLEHVDTMSYEIFEVHPSENRSGILRLPNRIRFRNKEPGDYFISVRPIYKQLQLTPQEMGVSDSSMLSQQSPHKSTLAADGDGSKAADWEIKPAPVEFPPSIRDLLEGVNQPLFECIVNHQGFDPDSSPVDVINLDCEKNVNYLYQTITDISQLSEFTSLRHIDFNKHNISNVEALVDLPDLELLDLGFNSNLGTSLSALDVLIDQSSLRFLFLEDIGLEHIPAWHHDGNGDQLDLFTLKLDSNPLGQIISSCQQPSDNKIQVNLLMARANPDPVKASDLMTDDDLGFFTNFTFNYVYAGQHKFDTLMATGSGCTSANNNVFTGRSQVLIRNNVFSEPSSPPELDELVNGGFFMNDSNLEKLSGALPIGCETYVRSSSITGFDSMPSNLPVSRRLGIGGENTSCSELDVVEDWHAQNYDAAALDAYLQANHPNVHAYCSLLSQTPGFNRSLTCAPDAPENLDVELLAREDNNRYKATWTLVPEHWTVTHYRIAYSLDGGAIGVGESNSVLIDAGETGDVTFELEQPDSGFYEFTIRSCTSDSPDDCSADSMPVMASYPLIKPSNLGFSQVEGITSVSWEYPDVPPGSEPDLFVLNPLFPVAGIEPIEVAYNTGYKLYQSAIDIDVYPGGIVVIKACIADGEAGICGQSSEISFLLPPQVDTSIAMPENVQLSRILSSDNRFQLSWSQIAEADYYRVSYIPGSGGNSIAPIIVEETNLDFERYYSTNNITDIQLAIQSCIRDRDNGDRCSSETISNVESIEDVYSLRTVDNVCWVDENQDPSSPDFKIRWTYNANGYDYPIQFITDQDKFGVGFIGPDFSSGNQSITDVKYGTNGSVTSWYWEKAAQSTFASDHTPDVFYIKAAVGQHYGSTSSISPVIWNAQINQWTMDPATECTGALALDNTPDPVQSPDTDGGPGDLNPGHWANTPDYRGTGWRLYWASDLRYDSLNASYGISYDLIGIWYAYAMIDGEWSPVWYYSRLKLTDPTAGNEDRFYEGDLIFPQENTPDQHVGSVRVYFDTTSIELVPLPQYPDADCSSPATPPEHCSEPNQNVWINVEVDHALLSGSLNHQLNDISLETTQIFAEPHSKDEHYSGLWLENGTLFDDGEALEGSGFILVEWMEKTTHSMGLNFFDTAGNPVWLVSQVCTNPDTDPSCRNLADTNGSWRIHDNATSRGNWHVMYPGVNPLGIVPEEWGPTSDHHATLGIAKVGRQFYDTNNDDKQDFITGKLCANISPFALGSRTASLTVGNSSCSSVNHAVDISKVASMHSIKYSLENNEIGSLCELSDTNPSCNILLTWFTDDYFPEVEPFYLVGDTGSIKHLSELCAGEAAAAVLGGDPDFVVADLPCPITQPGDYTFYLFSRTIENGSGIFPAQGGDIIAQSRILQVTGDCQTGCGNVVDVPNEVQNPSTMHTLAPYAEHDATVGSIAAEAGVSGGASSYSVPINIPPGRTGMQPSVSLNYNSRAGNGTVGMGWSLSAGSTISRCPSTVAQDGFSKGVTFDDSDRLCLDGQRLMVVEGQYWDSGSVYRTEIDNFARVELSGAGAASSGCSISFTVKDKDNITRHYGGGAATVTPDAADGGTACVASSWLLNSEHDPIGNDIRYAYTDFGFGEHLLDQIIYTGLNGSAGNRSVRLTYVDRLNGGQDDVSVSFLNGYVSRQTKRLDRIDTYVGSEHVRRYGLAYSNSQATGRLLLNSIQECAYTDVATCLPPTTLGWGDERPQFTWEPVMTDRSGGGSTQLLVENDPLGIGTDDQPNPGRLISLPDLDGDGSREWEFSDQDNTYIASIDAEGIERWRVTKDLTLPAQGSGGSGPVSQTQFRIRLNDDANQQQQEALQIATDYIASLSDDEIIATMALDEMAPEPGAQAIFDQRVLLGEQATTEIEAFQLSAVQSRDQYVDINTDGIVDLYGYVNNDDVDSFTFAVIKQNPGSSGSDFNAAFDLITTNINQFGRPVVGDINGDGNYDVLLRVPVTVTNTAGQVVTTDALQLWLNNGEDPDSGHLTFTLDTGDHTVNIDNIQGIIYIWPVNVPIESDGSTVYHCCPTNFHANTIACCGLGGSGLGGLILINSNSDLRSKRLS